MTDFNEANELGRLDQLDPRLIDPLIHSADMNEPTPDSVAPADAAVPAASSTDPTLGSLNALESMDEGMLASLASHLNPASANTPSVPTTPSGDIPVPMTIPTSIPTSTVDLRNLLSGQSATAAQPIGMASRQARTPGVADGMGLRSGSAGQEFDVNAVRADFPILHQEIHGKPLIWFDNAATTQKPQSVIDAISAFYERDNSNVHRGAHTLAARSTDAYEQARDKVARFIGASTSEEIVFVRGTTEGINLVAKTWGRKNIGAGDEIVVTTLEHHANIVPWQMLAQETGAVIRVVPVTNRGEILMEEYGNLLGPKTKLVAFTQVSNAIGTILPVKEMIAMARRYGAHVLVDGAQSIPHLPINVQQLDADWFVFSGHKLFGPTGIGAVFGKKDVLESMPPWQGGGNMIESVSFEKTTYHKPPTKFEAGTGNLADAVGLGAAIDYVSAIGMDRIAAYEKMLTEYAANQMKDIPGLRLVGTAPEKAAVLSFVMDGMQPEDVARKLDQEGIAVRAGHHCAQPTVQRFGLTGTVRPSLTVYNTHEEIDAMVAALMRIGL